MNMTATGPTEKLDKQAKDDLGIAACALGPTNARQPVSCGKCSASTSAPPAPAVSLTRGSSLVV